MDRARIRSILAKWRPTGWGRLRLPWRARLQTALAGLLLVALLLSNATARPVMAAATATERSPRGWDASPASPAGAPLPGARADGAEATDGAEPPEAAPRPRLIAPSGQATPAITPLQHRLQQWPAWRLPAPLARPGRQAPGWPAWFNGEWQVESIALSEEPGETARSSPTWRARFRADGRGGTVADRAFNAFSVGRSALGTVLLSVQDDPANPQRQLARLAQGQQLETTLIGQRSERPRPDLFLNDELSLQVLHGPGEPRVSRIETLGRWQRLADGSIAGEQWQARYASPAEGLAAAALSSDHWRLRLVPVPPGSDPATGTGEPAAGYR